MTGSISLVPRETFALAVFLDAPLWRDDRALQGHAAVVVLTTADLIDTLDR